MTAREALQIVGVRETARALKLSPSSVAEWTKHGNIPLAHRRAVAYLLRKKNRPELASRVESMAGGKAPRQKGDRFERDMVNALAGLPGVVARRVPLSGACEGFPGDIEILVRGFKLLCQCKISKTGSGYVKVTDQITLQGPVTFTDSYGLKIVAMHLEDFKKRLSSIHFAAYPAGALHRAKVTIIRNALAGHHILFFRKDRGDVGVIMPLDVYDFLTLICNRKLA